ncbi:MAG: fumarate hydratase [Betaproteobacteria bacterium RIFCSPLOWO2_02_FULL_62_17]|nr:MAG: fumarate hydratase [Betaproteobacteria bacterium RIFCSPLOWO2_02_FULL_62_17]
MNKTHHLKLPVSERDVRALTVGDTVYLHGEIVMAAGLLTHQRIIEYLEAGKPLPVDLKGGAMLHIAGYSREVDGRCEVLYINPTTSTRFNDYMPRIITGLGLRLTGGKGGLDARSVQAMREAGCAYLSFLGGGSTLLTKSLKEVISVNWTDLIFHYRLVKVRVEELGPATVGIDAHGGSLYESITRDAQARVPDILAGLGPRRSTASHSKG